MSCLLPFDGKLSKYTNVMKGWQNRYFILNPQQGILEYHISKQEAMGTHHRPRGSIVLAGAVIAPSTEDSFTFSVNSTNGEVYKLRAISTKERQEWVSNLRAVTEHFTHQIAQEHPPLNQSFGKKPRSRSMVSNLSTNLNKIKDQVQNLSTGQPTTSQHGENNSSSVDHYTVIQHPSKHSTKSKKLKNSSSNSRKSHSGKRALQNTEIKELQDAKEALVSVDNYQTGLISMLDDLRYHDTKADKNESNSTDENEVSVGRSCDTITALDTSVLLMKSTSASMLQSLNKCYNILQRYSLQSNPALPTDADIKWVATKLDSNSDSTSKEVASFEVPTLADASDEEEDKKDETEQELGAVDEHKNIIMHLLSQLKLGMDLTKVTLPTFILEKRSLLEMYADFVACTDLLLDIPNGTTPVERMHKTLKFYLASFYSGRKAQVAKKPYNPIVGEVFQCSYYVPKDNSTSQPKENCHRVQFLAEQVSHHPPVSAFYASCPDKGITVNSHIWTKSKFMNMSVGVANIGEGVLNLSELDENYTMNYPSAFARSILTVPWTELGGRCNINCAETNLTCNIIFHTKPMYGGQPHRVTAEVKDQKSGFISCKVSGKWNGELEFSYYTKKNDSDEVCETTEVLNTSNLKQYHKYLRPMEKQSAMESRTLWHSVTETLRKGDVASATEHKSALEAQQREVENRRSEEGLEVPLAYFVQVKGKEFDSYVFNQKPQVQS